MTYILTYNTLVSSIQNYTETFDNDNFNEQIPQFIMNAEIKISRDLKQLEAKRTVVGAFTPNVAVYQKPSRWRQTVSMNYASNDLYQITARQNASGTRTLTTSTAHPFTVGSQINVLNVGGSGYNGTFIVTAVTQYTVSYLSGSGTEAQTADSGYATGALQSYTSILPRAYEYCRLYWPDLSETGAPVFYADIDYNHYLVVPTPQVAYPFQITYYETPDHLSDANQENWLSQNAPDLLLYACLLETAPFLKNDQRLQVWQQMYTSALGSKQAELNARKNDATNNRDVGL